jgi:hypothetical protein
MREWFARRPSQSCNPLFMPSRSVLFFTEQGSSSPNKEPVRVWPPSDRFGPIEGLRQAVGLYQRDERRLRAGARIEVVTEAVAGRGDRTR